MFVFFFCFFSLESIITCLKSKTSILGCCSKVSEQYLCTQFKVYASILVLCEQKHSHYSSHVIMSHVTFDPSLIYCSNNRSPPTLETLMSVSHNIPPLFAVIAFVVSAVFIFILALK